MTAQRGVSLRGCRSDAPTKEEIIFCCLVPCCRCIDHSGVARLDMHEKYSSFIARYLFATSRKTCVSIGLSLCPS